MPAKGHLKPAVADHLIDVHTRNGTLDKVLNSGIGDDLRAHLEVDRFVFALGVGVTAEAGSEPWLFDGTRLRLVADINPGEQGSEVIAITWVGGRAYFVGFDGHVENLYAFDPVNGSLSVELAALSATARSSQIALSADRFLVVTTADPGLTENRKLLFDTQSGETRDLLDGTDFEDSPYTPVIPAGELGDASYFAVNGLVDGVYQYQLLRLDTQTGAVERIVADLAFEQAGGVAGDRLFFGAREAGESGPLVLYSLDAQGNLRDYPMPDGYLTGIGGDFVGLGEDVYFRTAGRYESDINRIDAAGNVTRIENHAVMVGTAGPALVLLDIEGPDTHFFRIDADGTRTDFAPLPLGEATTLDHAIVGGDLYYTTYDEETLGQSLYRLDIATGAVDLIHQSNRIDIRAVAGVEVLLAVQEDSGDLPDGPTEFFTIDAGTNSFAGFDPVEAPDSLRFGWDLIGPSADTPFV